jgi:hypothetical protein
MRPVDHDPSDVSILNACQSRANRDPLSDRKNNLKLMLPSDIKQEKRVRDDIWFSACPIVPIKPELSVLKKAPFGTRASCFGKANRFLTP